MLIKPSPDTGKFIIRWICSNGTKTSLRLAGPMIAVPSVENEMRKIAFTTGSMTYSDQTVRRFDTEREVPR